MGPHSRVPEANLLRARQMSEHWEETRASHRFEDPRVWSYAKFLYDIRGMDPVQQAKHFAVKPKLGEFYSLLQASVSFAPPSLSEASRSVPIGPEQHDRGLIKAMVVANAPAEYIASQLAYSIHTIMLFEYLAWDVRSRLNARGWLHNNVFSGGLFQETAMTDFEGMCIHAAYTAGLKGVERLLCLTQVETQEEIEMFQAQYSREISRKALTAVQTLPLNTHTSPEIMIGYAQWQKNAQDGELKRKAAGSGKGNTDDLATRLSETLKVPGFTVAKTTVQYEGPAEEQRSGISFQRALDEITAEAQLEVAK